MVSTIKIDEGLKEELTHLQSIYHRNSGQPSYNELVKRALKIQKITPLIMRYIKAKIDDWNPYDLLSWCYAEQKSPLEKELVESYAELVEEIQSHVGGEKV